MNVGGVGRASGGIIASALPVHPPALPAHHLISIRFRGCTHPTFAFPEKLQTTWYLRRILEEVMLRSSSGWFFRNSLRAHRPSSWLYGGVFIIHSNRNLWSKPSLSIPQSFLNNEWLGRLHSCSHRITITTTMTDSARQILQVLNRIWFFSIYGISGEDAWLKELRKELDETQQIEREIQKDPFKNFCGKPLRVGLLRSSFLRSQWGTHSSTIEIFKFENLGCGDEMRDKATLLYELFQFQKLLFFVSLSLADYFVWWFGPRFLFLRLKPEVGSSNLDQGVIILITPIKSRGGNDLINLQNIQYAYVVIILVVNYCKV